MLLIVGIRGVYVFIKLYNVNHPAFANDDGMEGIEGTLVKKLSESSNLLGFTFFCRVLFPLFFFALKLIYCTDIA